MCYFLHKTKIRLTLSPFFTRTLHLANKNISMMKTIISNSVSVWNKNSKRYFCVGLRQNENVLVRVIKNTWNITFHFFSLWMSFFDISWVNPPIFSLITLHLDPPQIMAKHVICQRWHMTYDTNNICQYGCLWNRNYLSNEAPGFKVGKKFINMPKKRKTKKLKFPLYFEDFSFINFGR